MSYGKIVTPPPAWSSPPLHVIFSRNLRPASQPSPCWWADPWSNLTVEQYRAGWLTVCPQRVFLTSAGKVFSFDALVSVSVTPDELEPGVQVVLLN